MAILTSEEKYRFETLDQLDKAIIKAFGSYDNSACSFEKGLILKFKPTGSLVYDTHIRNTISQYGGKLIVV